MAHSVWPEVPSGMPPGSVFGPLKIYGVIIDFVITQSME